MSVSDSTNMAACYVRALRTALKGVHLVPGRWLLTQSSHAPAACQCRPLHVSPAASLCSPRTEPRRSPGTDDSRAAAEEEEEPEGPEYIPTKKAKNPMKLIAYAWMIGLPTGIITFLLAKREVDKNRIKQLKVRQRMKRSNEGEYEGTRYHRHSDSVNMDQ